MRIRFALLCAVAATALASTGAALGAGHTTPGTPGAANCKGETFAFLNENFGVLFDVHGLGNSSRFVGLSVKEAQAEIDAYCNP